MSYFVEVEAVVVGSGPNGLAAAIELAGAGLRVLVLEGADHIGGGMRTEALTRPGFLHDVCSAVHPMALSSPAFTAFALERFGLSWCHPAAPLVHPLDGGAVVLHRSVRRTAAGLGRDGARYTALMRPFADRWKLLSRDLLTMPQQLPARPLQLARFGALAVQSATRVAKSFFRDAPARALFAGIAAHSTLPLERPGSAAFGLVLGAAAHAVGWPVARGGSQAIADALAACLRTRGGDVRTGRYVGSLDELPPAGVTLLDLTPRQVLRVAGPRLPTSYRRHLARYRYGPAAFKIDWALDAPIPWRAPACTQAATVHVGGTLEEIAAAERAAWDGHTTAAPFVLVVQPTLFDASRAPAGCHTAWAYCHVPHASTADMTPAIEAQIERFAPGFRDRILARHVLSPGDLERRNPNLVGGDIGGGVQDLWQLAARPTWRQHATPTPGLFLCSSSTLPGGGVHGMCGTRAARAALRSLRTDCCFKP